MLQKCPVLFYKKEQCCGCGACLNRCPREVIRMQEDENGFRYPAIDAEYCIFCGRCLESCGYQFGKVESNLKQTFTVVPNLESESEKTAVERVLEDIGRKVLADGGAVFGATEDGDGKPKHKKIDSAEELYKLQGTKHMYSNIGRTFSEAKEILLKELPVLFVATSCQIAGFYGYLGKYAKFERLLTIDFACPKFGGARRENCHPCKYDWGKRPSDITVREKRGRDKGDIRVTLTANTETGLAFLNQYCG